MSWQAYVDTSLLATGMVSKAAIHGLDGNRWASSAGFTVQPNEVKELVAGLKNPDKLFGGLHIGGQKYVFLRHEPDRSVYGRKGGDSGCVVVKTGQCVVIGIYEGGVQGGACTAVVEKLGDYLVSNGY